MLITILCNSSRGLSKYTINSVDHTHYDCPYRSCNAVEPQCKGSQMHCLKISTQSKLFLLSWNCPVWQLAQLLTVNCSRLVVSYKQLTVQCVQMNNGPFNSCNNLVKLRRISIKFSKICNTCIDCSPHYVVAVPWKNRPSNIAFPLLPLKATWLLVANAANVYTLKQCPIPTERSMGTLTCTQNQKIDSNLNLQYLLPVCLAGHFEVFSITVALSTAGA